MPERRNSKPARIDGRVIESADEKTTVIVNWCVHSCKFYKQFSVCKYDRPFIVNMFVNEYKILITYRGLILLYVGTSICFEIHINMVLMSTVAIPENIMFFLNF